MTYVRGFAEEIVIRWDDFVEHRDKWLKATPLRFVSFATWPEVYRYNDGGVTLSSAFAFSDPYSRGPAYAMQTPNDVLAALRELWPSLTFRVRDAQPPGMFTRVERNPWPA